MFYKLRMQFYVEAPIILNTVNRIKKTLLKSVFSFYLGARLYFNLNRISTYLVNKFLAIILLSIS